MCCMLVVLRISSVCSACIQAKVGTIDVKLAVLPTVRLDMLRLTVDGAVCLQTVDLYLVCVRAVVCTYGTSGSLPQDTQSQFVAVSRVSCMLMRDAPGIGDGYACTEATGAHESRIVTPYMKSCMIHMNVRSCMIFGFGEKHVPQPPKLSRNSAAAMCVPASPVVCTQQQRQRVPSTAHEAVYSFEQYGYTRSSVWFSSVRFHSARAGLPALSTSLS